ncbi:MAG: photosynthetic complex assembly protein PuhC, partial [Pseudomonadota bacterium]
SGQEPFGQPQLGPILAERVVHLDGDARGAALITDAAGETITEYGAGEGGFVSTIDRGIQFRRHQLGADETAPVIVRMHEGSIVSIYDPEVDHSYTLLSYGPDNIAHFAALVTPPAE